MILASPTWPSSYLEGGKQGVRGSLGCPTGAGRVGAARDSHKEEAGADVV